MRKGNFLTAFLLVAAVLFPVAGWAQTSPNQDHDEPLLQAEGMGEYQAAMKKVYDNYFAIRASLAKDTMRGVSSRAKAISKALEGISQDALSDAAGEDTAKLNALLADIRTTADSIAEKKDIAQARAEFGKLSEQLVEHQKHFTKGESQKTYVFICDMAKKMWLQENSEPGNPYYGRSMAKCARKLEAPYSSATSSDNPKEKMGCCNKL